MIREARPGDLDALEPIQTRSLPEPNPELLRYVVEQGSTSNRPQAGHVHGSVAPVSKPEANASGDAAEHKNLVLVSVREGDPVGYVLVLVGDGEAHVAELAVAAAHRREGRGRLLLASALARLGDCEAVSLTVQPGNAAARSLYRELGFEETERKEDFYGDGKPAIEMRRRLS